MLFEISSRSTRNIISYRCFVQAEDGIRDWSVTGVQTCALPILIRAVDAQLGNTAQVQRASTDANIPLSLGREAIAIGGGGSGGGAHTLQEWFDCNGRELGLRRILLTMLTLSGVGE